MDQKEVIRGSVVMDLLYFFVKKHDLYQEQYLPSHLGAAQNCL